jgi:hypothetical protein
MIDGDAPRPPDSLRPRLRPLGFGELLDQVFRVYRAHFGLMISVSLILAIPVLLVQVVGTAPAFAFDLEVLRNPYAFSAGPPPSIGSLYNVPLLLIGYAVLLLATPFTMATAVVAALRVLHGDRPTVAELFLDVARRYHWLLLLVLLYGCIGLTLCCLPVGIWLLVRFAVAVPALVTERPGPIAALRRSWELTSGGWWRTFGLFAILYLIGSVVGGILGSAGLPIAIAVPFIPAIVRGVIVSVASSIGSVLAFPLISIGVALLYIDFRVRREAYDLEQLAREAAGGGGSAP